MKAKCKNCNQPIHKTHAVSAPPWSHGPLWNDYQPHCPTTAVAEPAEGTES